MNYNPEDWISVVNSRTKTFVGDSYKLSDAGQYGLDSSFTDEDLDIDPKSMSIVIPFADGRRRDGVGDLLEVTGIKTERHRQNPVVLFDHGKEVKMPVAKAEDPETKVYTVSIDGLNKVAKVKAFFYGSKSEQQSFDSLSNYAEQGDRFKHAVFCEQLFDLMAKGFVRGGSIGYQVLQATQLPVDHSKGTPQGLHLLSVLMLEASAVVMPANMDTVRKALEFKSLCGHPMSEVLVKSLSCHCGPKPVMLGYEGKKSITVQIPHGNLSNTNVPPAEWRPGVGAIKSLRGKYKATRSAKIHHEDVRSYAQHGQLHAPATQRRSATIHRDDVQHYNQTGPSESIPYAQEVKQPKSNNHHAAIALGGAALAAGAGYGAYRAGKWAVNKIRGKKAFNYSIVKGDTVELAAPIASGPHYEGQRLLYNPGEVGSVLYDVGPDGTVWVKMPDGGVVQMDANAVKVANPTKSLRRRYKKDMGPKSRADMERQNADKMERWLREREKQRLNSGGNQPPLPPEEGGNRDDGNNEDPYRAIKAALIIAGLLGAVVVTKVGSRWLVRKLKPVASNAYESFKDQLRRRFGKVRDTGEAVEIEVKSLGQKAYLDQDTLRELSREFLFQLREDLRDIGVEGVAYGDVTHYGSTGSVESFFTSIKLPERDSRSTGRIGDIINYLKSRGYTLGGNVGGYQNKRAVLMLVGGVSADSQTGNPYQKALDPNEVENLASRGRWSDLQEYVEEQYQADGMTYGEARFQANKVVQEERQRRAVPANREPRTPEFERATPQDREQTGEWANRETQRPQQIGEVVHRNEINPQEIQLAIINAIPFVVVGGTITTAMLIPLVHRVIDWLQGKGKKVTPKTKQVIEQEVLKEVKKRSKKSLTGQKAFDLELAVQIAVAGDEGPLSDYLKDTVNTNDMTAELMAAGLTRYARNRDPNNIRSELIWLVNTYGEKNLGTKSLDLRSKYRPVKGYVRRLRKSKPGSSVLYVHEKDLQRVRREAETRGVKYKYGGNRDGYERVVLNGDDSLIDDIARKFGRPVAAGNYQTKSKRKK